MRVAGIFIVSATLLLTNGAHAAGLLSYGMRTADAEETVDGKRFSVYVHPTEDRLLLQPKMAEMFKNPAQWPLVVWRHAAEAFVSPAGCGISEVAVHTRMGASWEATYVCPAGVDLRALVAAQRSELKQGKPLHVEATSTPVVPAPAPVKSPTTD